MPEARRVGVRPALKLTAKPLRRRKGFDEPDSEALITHTLTVFDSALEPRHEKKKR